MELKDRIALARKQAGLSQEQLGEQLGVSRQAVSKWESGQANPDVDYLTRMCALLGVSADWLLLGKETGGGAAPSGRLCPACSAPVGPSDAFCPACGASLTSEGTYCLYLSKCDEFTGAQVSRLFQLPYARPAFQWTGGEITPEAARSIVKAAPMVLCRGLTLEQAKEGARILNFYAPLVEIYRDEDVGDDGQGKEVPLFAPFVPAPPSQKEPMGPGMVFLMVVLGVIAALVILSLF